MTGDEELFDKEAFSQDKLFDENEFSTLIVNREGFSKKDNNRADLIEALLLPENTRKDNEELFSKLKEANAQALLVQSIGEAKNIEEKIKIASACWESGLDFTDYFLDFVALAMHHDFRLSLEALSVLESIDGVVDEATLNKAIEITETVHPINKDMVEQLKQFLKSRNS